MSPCVSRGDSRIQKRKRESPQDLVEKHGAATSNHSTVVRVKSSGKSCQDDQRSLSSMIALDCLMAPLDESRFLRDCFRHSAVHVSSSEVDSSESAQRRSMLREELFDLDPELILSSTSSDSVFVWLQNRNHLEDDLIHSIEVSDPSSALALYSAGHATYCRAPPTLEQLLVSTLLAETGLGCGQYDATGESSTCLGRGEVEVFLGTEGHRTGWHWDFQENFTVQLSGSKKWTLQKGSVAHPLRGCTPHYRSPDSVEPQLKAARLGDSSFVFGHPTARPGAEPEEVIMKAGDVLYFPAGMWHKVEVLEPGVSINVSLMAATLASVTCHALQHLLLQRTEWRESVVQNATTDVVTNLKTLLHKLPSIIEEFEREGGAAAILPPAVCGPKLRNAGQESHGDSDLDDEDDEGEDVDPKDLIDVACDKKSNNKPYKCSEQQLRKRFQSHRLVRNPLALLLRESEIFQFYKKDPTSDESEAESREIFVLNVNYAGTESHESLIRARILDTGNFLRQVYESSKTCHSDLRLPDLETWIGIELERTMLGCLVYHGFLVWVPRGDNAPVA